MTDNSPHNWSESGNKMYIDPLAQDYSQPTAAMATGSDPPVLNHVHVVCDQCNKPVFGVRYKCGNCPNYDLCEQCEAVSCHRTDHVFLKIRWPSSLAGKTTDGTMVPLLKQNIYSQPIPAHNLDINVLGSMTSTVSPSTQWQRFGSAVQDGRLVTPLEVCVGNSHGIGSGQVHASHLPGSAESEYSSDDEYDTGSSCVASTRNSTNDLTVGSDDFIHLVRDRSTSGGLASDTESEDSYVIISLPKCFHSPSASPLFTDSDEEVNAPVAEYSHCAISVLKQELESLSTAQPNGAEHVGNGEVRGEGEAKGEGEVRGDGEVKGDDPGLEAENNSRGVSSVVAGELVDERVDNSTPNVGEAVLTATLPDQSASEPAFTAEAAQSVGTTPPPADPCNSETSGGGRETGGDDLETIEDVAEYAIGKALKVGQGLANNLLHFLNTLDEYEPSKSDWAPPPQQWAPPHSSWAPTTSEYVPRADTYVPRSSNWVPKPDSYVLPTSNWTPPPDDYVPPRCQWLPADHRSVGNGASTTHTC